VEGHVVEGTESEGDTAVSYYWLVCQST
jgi:hypothetical protein